MSGVRMLGRYAWMGVKLVARAVGALIAAALGAFVCLLGLTSFEVPAGLMWGLVALSAAAAGVIGWWSFKEAIRVITDWIYHW